MNARNERTTHPQIRRRRERALERFSIRHHTVTPAYLANKDIERAALTRKLSQRKQGSAK